ncbi:hypothetical protein GGI42DRAFT_207691 [Trichoderma sp. SZMC 28013]
MPLFITTWQRISLFSSPSARDHKTGEAKSFRFTASQRASPHQNPSRPLPQGFPPAECTPALVRRSDRRCPPLLNCLFFLFLDRQTPANKRHTYEVAGGISCMSAGQALHPTTSHLPCRVKAHPSPCSSMCCEPHLCLSLASSYPREIRRSRQILILSRCAHARLTGWGAERVPDTRKRLPGRHPDHLFRFLICSTPLLCCAVQITKVSLAYSHCPAPIRPSFFLSSRFRCVCRSSSGKSFWSHHRHVDYTRATLGPLHTFVSSTSSVFFLSQTLLSC